MAALLLAAAAAASATSTSAAGPLPLAATRGINYVPSYAQHPLQTLLNHDSAVVHQELGWLGGLGFNAARIFLNYLPWQRDPDAFFAVTDDLVDAASANGMRVFFVVFDSTCGDASACDATQEWIDSGYYNDVATWVPNPGPLALTNLTLRPTLDAYVAALVGRYANDSRLLGWDMHNEPEFSDPNILPFLEHTFPLIQAADPSPLHIATSGVSFFSQQPLVSSLVRTLSFHMYDAGGAVPGANLAAAVAQQRQYAQSLGKDVIMTEAMGRPGDPLTAILFGMTGCAAPTPAANASASDASAPASVPMGFFLWEGMNGRDEWGRGWPPYQGLLYPATAGPAFAGRWLVPDEALWWKAFAGITGPGVTSPCPAPPATTYTAVADTDPCVSYTPVGAWTQWSGTGPRGGTLHYSNVTGANATITISGATTFSVIHKTGPDCGILRIIVDGAVVGTIDAFTMDPVWYVEAPAFVLQPSAAQQHTVTVQGTGASNPLASDTYVQVVGFNVYA